MTEFSRTLIPIVGFAFLSACGGGGGSSSKASGAPDPAGPGAGLQPEITVPVVTDVVPLVDPVVSEGAANYSFQGKSFPAVFITRDPDGGTPQRVAGIVEYTGEDRFRITYDGVTSDYGPDASGRNIVLTGSTDPNAAISQLKVDDVQFWNPNAGPNSTGEINVKPGSFQNSLDETAFGVYGFEAPEGALTGSVTYIADLGMTLLFSGPGYFDEDGTDQNHVERNQVIETSWAEDSLRLTANFDDNSISGVLFDGRYTSTDERGLTGMNTKSVLLELENGVIDGSGFTGDLSLTVTPESNPGTGAGLDTVNEPSILTIKDQDISGHFLGAAGKGISGSLAIDYTETYQRPLAFEEFSEEGDFEVTEDRSIVGVFIGAEETQ